MDTVDLSSKKQTLSQISSEKSTGKANLRIVHSEAKSNGEEVHLVRPSSENILSSNDIVNRLVNQYSYKTQGVIAEK